MSSVRLLVGTELSHFSSSGLWPADDTGSDPVESHTSENSLRIVSPDLFVLEVSYGDLNGAGAGQSRRDRSLRFGPLAKNLDFVRSYIIRGHGSVVDDKRGIYEFESIVAAKART